MPDGTTRHPNQRINELEALNQLSLRLGSSEKVYDILSGILDSSLSICQAERAAVLLFSPDSADEPRTLVRSIDASLGSIDHSLNQQVAGWVQHHGQPFIAANVTEALRLPKVPERWKSLGSALAVPLTVESRIVGILHLLNSREGRIFTEENLEFAAIIASMAAQFIHKAKLSETLFEANLRLKTALQHEYGVHRILGESTAIHQVIEKIDLAAKSPTATVLLIGDTGTGKELVARAVHLKSARADAPFVAVNCSAIPAALVEPELFGHVRGAFTGATEARKGKFALANHGTLFLDEVADMPLEIQPKLLRVLEERKFYPVGSSTEQCVDVRVIAASSKDLHKATQDGKFREELYYRLNVVPIDLPALRDRRGDIPILAQAFLAEFSAKTKRFTEDALLLLQKLEWRGNVRELRNVVERISIFVQSTEISAADISRLGLTTTASDASHLASALESMLQENSAQQDILEAVEKKLVELAMRMADGKVTHAAQLLGIERNALQRRIEKHNLSF